MAPVQSILKRFSAVTKMVGTPPKHEFLVQWIEWGAFGAKTPTQLVARTCVLIAPVRLVLHQLSFNNEMVRNRSKYEFWVQWSGSGMFFAKKSSSTSWHAPTFMQ